MSKCIANRQNRANGFRKDFDEIKKSKRKYTWIPGLNSTHSVFMNQWVPLLTIWPRETHFKFINTLIENDHLGDWSPDWRSIVGDSRFDNPCGRHLQSPVTWLWRYRCMWYSWVQTTVFGILLNIVVLFLNWRTEYRTLTANISFLQILSPFSFALGKRGPFRLSWCK